jgi:hypothetical protein
MPFVEFHILVVAKESQFVSQNRLNHLGHVTVRFGTSHLLHVKILSSTHLQRRAWAKMPKNCRTLEMY